MTADLTTFDAALKQHYTTERVEDMVYEDNPTFALMSKYENFGGRNLPIVLKYGNGQGRSKTFSNAQTRAGSTASRLHDFLLTRVKDYSIAQIDNELLEASKGDPNAFIEAATTEIDSAIMELTRSLAIGMFRDSAAVRGQVSAEPAEDTGSFVITLKYPEEIVNFELDQVLVMYAAKTGGSAKTSDGTDDEWVIEAIDRSAGTITLTGDYTSSGNITADDFIFIEGDRGNGISGFEGWLPYTAPGGSDLFFGVNRSVDVTRLSGLRLDGTGGPIEEILVEADSKVCREGKKIDHFVMNHSKFAELKQSLGSKVQYCDMVVSPRVSFQGVLISGDKGIIKCYPDQNCPSNRIYGLNMSTWKLYSLGKAVRVIDTDGLTMLRQATSDGVECRYGFYGNVGCKGPGSNIVIQV